MINLNPNDDNDLRILKTFADGDWRTGLELLKDREKHKTIKILTVTSPEKMGDISRAQCAYLIWNADICGDNGIGKQVDKFLAAEAAEKRGS